MRSSISSFSGKDAAAIAVVVNVEDSVVVTFAAELGKRDET
jgi:hypothetical protein